MLQERWTVLNDPPVIELEFRGNGNHHSLIFKFRVNIDPTFTQSCFIDLEFQGNIDSFINNVQFISKVDHSVIELMLIIH